MKFALPPLLWRYCSSLSSDVNFLDLASIVGRGSLSNKGQMGAVIVLASSDPSTRVKDRVWAAVNTPLVPNSSLGKTSASRKNDAEEIHAEALLVSLCAANGLKTAGSTMYITFPPCKSCFMTLCAAGVSRVVFRRWNASKAIAISAHMNGIDLVEGERFCLRPKPGQKWSKRWVDQTSDEYAGKIVETVTEGAGPTPGHVTLHNKSTATTFKRKLEEVFSAVDEAQHSNISASTSAPSSSAESLQYKIEDIPSEFLDSVLSSERAFTRHIAPLMYGPDNPSSDISRNLRVQNTWLRIEDPALVLQRKDEWWAGWHEKVERADEEVDKFEKIKVQDCIKQV